MIDGVWVWRGRLGGRIGVRKDERLQERRTRREQVRNDGGYTVSGIGTTACA